MARTSGDAQSIKGVNVDDTDIGDAKVLAYNASTGNLEYESIAGAGLGDVVKVGTPADSQVGVWTGDGTIEGAASLTYDGSNLQLTGDIGSTGTRITKGWFTDLQVTNAIAGDITGNAGTVTNGVYTGDAGTVFLEPDGDGSGLSGVVTAETDPIVGAITGIVKADGGGNISAATAGTDYVETETDPIVGAINGIVKADGAGNISSAVEDTDYQGVLAEGAFADGDKTKLDGIETSADVTDATNVEAAGALMDSELTDIAFVKAVSDAVASDLNTGTSTSKAVTPDALAGSNFGIRYVQVMVTAPTGETEAGDGAAYIHIPAAYAGMNLVEVHAEVITAPTGSAETYNIYNVTDSVDMLSTALTIDAGETGSDTAATAAVINTSNDDVAQNDLLRIDVDGVGSTTAAQGLIITLGFQLP